MKKLIPALFLSLALGGCTVTASSIQSAFTQDVATIEAKVAAFIAKVKTNAPIALADAQAAVSVACSLVPIVQSAESAIVSNVSGISSSVQSTLTTVDAYANKGNAACQAYNATQSQNLTPSAAVNTTVSVWNAYVAAKAQISAAQAKIAAGQ